ncbi:MAG: RNA polymerase sigma factor [Candidatus Pacebacteria bacterium]|nr:RNA polymerase sigma factor [Candidatus Paceibacterota bacterium]
MTQEDAYLEAFDVYSDALYRHAYFRVSDREKAKDLLADAFMKTWDYIRKGNVVDDFRPFLYRTLNRLIIDEYRKKKTESLDALLEDEHVPSGVFEELVDGSLEKLEWELDAKRVPELLEAMPEAYREVVVMRYIDGLMPAEIAEMLGEPVNSVSVRIHRGLQWLVKYVEPQK